MRNPGTDGNLYIMNINEFDIIIVDPPENGLNDLVFLFVLSGASFIIFGSC